MTAIEVRFMPDDKRVNIRAGTTLLDAGRRAQADIRTRCGGRAACLMCKVEVADQRGLEPPSRNERLKLGELLLQQGVRLACQARIRGPVTAIVPEDPLKAAVRRQLEQLRMQNDATRD